MLKTFIVLYIFLTSQQIFSQPFTNYSLYTDNFVLPSTPNGFMGQNNGSSLTIQVQSPDSPQSGSYCWRNDCTGLVEFWAGIYVLHNGTWRTYSSPPFCDLSDYNTLIFWARASSNIVVAEMGMGEAIDSSGQQKLLNQSITTNWQQFVLDLNGSLASVNGMFYYSANIGQTGGAYTLYFDNIYYTNIIKPPELQSPTNGSIVYSNNPLFRWIAARDGDVSNISNYTILISQDNFVSTQYQYTTTNNFQLHCSQITGLSNGTYYWYIYALTKENIIHISETNMFIVSNIFIPPSLDNPNNGIIFYYVPDLVFRWTKAIDTYSGISNYTILVSPDHFVSTQYQYTTPNNSQVSYSGITSLTDGTWSWFIYSTSRSGLIQFSSTNTFIVNNSIISGPWPMFRQNIKHTGQTNNNILGIQNNPILLWSYTTGGAIKSSPAIGPDGTVYIGSSDGKLYAITNGSQQWSYDTGGAISSSPAIGSDGTIYVGSDNTCLFAIKNGSYKWAWCTGNCSMIKSSPAIDAQNTIYGANIKCDAVSIAAIFCINTNGGTLWTYWIGAGPNYWFYSSPLVGSDSTLYIGCEDHNVYAVTNAGSYGALKWSYGTSGAVRSSPVIGLSNTIYIGSEDGNMYAITNGGLKWSYNTGGPISSSPVLGSDGTIYFGSDDGKLYAVLNGSLQWSYTTGGAINSSPAIGSDDTVYVGSDDGKLYAVLNGSLQWSYTTGGAITSSPAIGSDGMIYFGSDDGKLYALYTESILSLSKSISNVTLNTNQSTMVPGGTITYKIIYSNSSQAYGYNVIIYDKISSYVSFQTQNPGNTTGWNFEYSTNMNPNQNYHSSNYNTGTPGSNTKWIRWKKSKLEISSEKGYLLYKVIIK